MDNLINFDNEEFAPRPKSPMDILIPEKLYGVKYSEDPFDHLETLRGKVKTDQTKELIDGSLFTFEYFSNASSMDSSHMTHQESESSFISAGSQKTGVSRSHSDSSTISSKSTHEVSRANHSVDNIHAKNQLLKLSLFNSTSSPMKGQSLSTSLVFAEAKKIAKQFADSREISFEDLNNVSQPQEASDVSFVDPDLQAMSLKVPTNHLFPSKSPTTKPTAEKIAEFQEQLKRIKKEVELDDNDDLPKTDKMFIESTSTPVKIKVEKGEENQFELDKMLHKLRSVITDGNKDAAKKHLNRLNELLEKQKDQNECKNSVNVVQPIVRQATFEIDASTGKRKYTSNEEPPKKSGSDEIVEKLTKLLAGQTLDIHSISANGEKLVLVLPSSVTSTPEKKSLERIPPKAHSSMKSIDNKILGTPLKRQAMTRAGSFTTPRPLPASRRTNPYDQKLGAGAVRKSLMSSIDKSPQVQKTRVSSTPGTFPKSTGARRSVSMKESIPAVQVTNPSPMKVAPRPSTGAPYASMSKRLSLAPGSKARPSTTNVSSSSRARTLSDHKKPVSQFKAPSTLRKGNCVDKNGSLV